MPQSVMEESAHFCELYADELRTSVYKDAIALGNSYDLFGIAVRRPSELSVGSKPQYAFESDRIVRIYVPDDELTNATICGLTSFVTFNCLLGARSISAEVLGDAPGIAFEVGKAVVRRTLLRYADNQTEYSGRIANYSFVAGRNGALSLLRSSRKFPQLATNCVECLERPVPNHEFGRELVDLINESNLEILPVIWHQLQYDGRVPRIREIASLTNTPERTVRRRILAEKHRIRSAFNSEPRCAANSLTEDPCTAS